MTVDDIIEQTLRFEGGFANRSVDRGGPTNYGVTQKTYSKWLGRPATIDDVKTMPRETAKEIYLKNYFYAPRINGLPEPVQPQLFDMCVLHGERNAIKMLQHVLCLAGFTCTQDGVIGPATIKTTAEAEAAMGPFLTNAISEAREEFCEAIVIHDPPQRVNLKGWLARAREFRVEVP